MPLHTAVRGLRRAELITNDPAESARFHRALLDWALLPAGNGFDCWVGDRRCATLRPPKAGERPGWQLVFAGAAQDGTLTGPDDTSALLAKGRAQHGPWAPGPRVGEPCWVELFADDATRADSFWTDSLAWTAEPAASDTVYAISGRPVASRTSARQPDGRWGWLCYFTSEDLDLTEIRVKSNGGKVVGRTHHDRVGDTLLAADPGGALIALVGQTESWGGR